MTKKHHTDFDPTHRILTTGLTGTVQVDDVEAWTADLRLALGDLADNSTFTMICDLQGYAPGSLDAHKSMRNVIPEVLAQHGMRPAYIDLFDPRPDVAVDGRPRARCVAFANVYHDAEHMVDYEQRAGKPNQRFFSDIDAARQWIGHFG